jgi:hypothetical protein
MKETTRLSPPSLSNCLDATYQYTLLQPFIYEYLEETYCFDSTCSTTCNAAYPDEWNIAGGFPCLKRPGTTTPRFTCLTELTTGTTVTNLATAIAGYSTACTYGTISIDGRYLNGAGSLGSTPSNFGTPCITDTAATESSDASSTDNTLYQNQSYHTITSLLHHVSPTDDEIAAATANGATPSLAINVIRSVEFLTPSGAVEKVDYPNFFSEDAPDTTVADMREWLSSISSSAWSPIVNRESTRPISSFDAALNSSLRVNPIPAT